MANIMDEECVAMVKYLTGKIPDDDLFKSYQYATQKLPVAFSSKEQKLWNTCLKNPRLIPYIDAYLGFSEPTHPIRKKLFI